MNTFTFTVRVDRKPGLSDPEGAATARALHDLGFANVGRVAFGRTITVEVRSASEETARDEVATMCDKLLANPVIENYSIEVAT